MNAMTLLPAQLGDRQRTAPGWLIVSDGALRGLLSEGALGEAPQQ
jgi:hypothetical protein